MVGHRARDIDRPEFRRILQTIAHGNCFHRDAPVVAAALCCRLSNVQDVIVVSWDGRGLFGRWSGREGDRRDVNENERCTSSDNKPFQHNSGESTVIGEQYNNGRPSTVPDMEHWNTAAAAS